MVALKSPKRVKIWRNSTVQNVDSCHIIACNCIILYQRNPYESIQSVIFNIMQQTMLLSLLSPNLSFSLRHQGDDLTTFNSLGVANGQQSKGTLLKKKGWFMVVYYNLICLCGP